MTLKNLNNRSEKYLQRLVSLLTVFMSFDLHYFNVRTSLLIRLNRLIFIQNEFLFDKKIVSRIRYYTSVNCDLAVLHICSCYSANLDFNLFTNVLIKNLDTRIMK